MPVKIIAFANQKGGVGKTTASMLAADALHRKGHRVLVVDTDPQKSAHQWEMLQVEGYAPFPVKVEVASGFKNRDQFINWLQKRQSEYDYLIIDTPPNLQSAELYMTLMVADLLIVPFYPHASSVDALQGFSQLIAKADSEREMTGNKKLDVRLLLNRVDTRYTSVKALVDSAPQISPWPVMATQLKQLSAFLDANNYRTSIYSLPNTKAAKLALLSLAEELS